MQSWTAIQRILTGEQLMTVYQPMIEHRRDVRRAGSPIAQGEEPHADLATEKVDNGAKQVHSVCSTRSPIVKDNIERTRS